MFLISIPKPCHENWNEMSPRDKGAFCKVCAKTVIDFTSLSDEEVKNYFLKYQDQKTCGRFRNQQLTDAENPLPQLLVASIPFWKKFLAIVFILFGSFLSGCERPVKGKTLTSQENTEQLKENVTLGVIMPEITEEVQMGKPEIEECSLTKGFTVPVIITDTPVISEDIMGDIEISLPQKVTYKELIQDSIRNINPGKPKVDSAKKIITSNDCDTIPTRAIEP